MRVFFDAGAFLKVLKMEDGHERVVHRLVRVREGEDTGFTDTIVIAEIAYAFLSRGLDDEAVKARAYIESIPNLTVVENVPPSISHRGAELKKKYFKRSAGTFFSLYDAIHLAVAERHCETFMTSDTDFEGVTELEVELV
jgi:predicted nucleic acid-binding protein